MPALEGERIARLEQRADDRDAALIRMEGKLDTLIEAFNMGRGAARLAAKIGGVLVLGAAALGWVWDHVLAPLVSKH